MKIQKTYSKQEPKTYFCSWKNAQISGAAARNCNNLHSLETYECNYQDFCVAKEGLEKFAQSLAKGIKGKKSSKKDPYEQEYEDPTEQEY